MSSSDPSWPTKRRASGSETAVAPGGQHVASRRKRANRCGLPRALNISASRCMLSVLLFDIFRSIELKSPLSRKKSTEKEIASPAGVYCAL